MNSTSDPASEASQCHKLVFRGQPASHSPSNEGNAHHLNPRAHLHSWIHPDKNTSIIARFKAVSMSLLTPRQTPEAFDSNEPSTPSYNRTIVARPSPVKSLRALRHTLFSPFQVSPSPSSSAESGAEDEGEDEVQNTVSSSSDPTKSKKQARHKSILASLRNNRERRDARAARVDRLINLIEKVQHGAYLGRREVISTQLFPKDYLDLLVEVDERDRDFQLFFHHGLRYEYRESLHGKKQFKILMLSAFHISIQKSIDHKLLCWRDGLVSNKDYGAESRTAAGKIDSTRDQKMRFESNKKLRGDCAFTYEEDHYTHPPLIFEIAWSQSTADLEARAMELIEEGAGQIRTIIGLDFHETWKIWDTIRDEVGNSVDPKRGPFTAFVWRVAFDRSGRQISNANGQPRVQKSKYVFCNDEGTANPTERLRLKLRDFVPARVIKAEGWDKLKDLDDATLELDTPTMLGYFDSALKRQKLEDENIEPEKQEVEEEKRKVREERAAKRRAKAEEEHRRWGISSLISFPIGGHSLRRLPGRS